VVIILIKILIFNVSSASEISQTAEGFKVLRGFLLETCWSSCTNRA
jgi:hypothetical protein